MPAVINIDQRGSRRRGLEPTRLLLKTLEADPGVRVEIPFAQSGGDELQGVLGETGSLLRVLRHVAEHGESAVGIGLGQVTGYAGSVHQFTGPAFFRARDAINRAKRVAWRVSVVGDDGAMDFEGAASLWMALLARRTAAGWEVVTLAEQGVSVAESAATLNISQQAVTKRLRVAEWRLDKEGQALLMRLGERAFGQAS